MPTNGNHCHCELSDQEIKVSFQFRDCSHTFHLLENRESFTSLLVISLKEVSFIFPAAAVKLKWILSLLNLHNTQFMFQSKVLREDKKQSVECCRSRTCHSLN